MKARLDTFVAAGLFVAAFLALLATEQTIGFVRDESVYFAAAEGYARWYQLLWHQPVVAVSDGAIVRAFEFNREHPVLFKTLFGLSEQLFSENLHWVRPATGFRIPALLVAALIPAVLYQWGRRLFSRTAGAFAALSFFAVPRQFFHAHLACFDLPIAAMWLFTTYAYVRARTSRRWALACGLLFGLALATKHNAFFLPVLLGPFALAHAWQETNASANGRARLVELVAGALGWATLLGILWLVQGPARFVEGLDLLSPAVGLTVLGLGLGAIQLRRLGQACPHSADALLPLAAMVVLGPAILYAHWPFLWHHPVERLAWYLAFHATHNHYAWMYLGELLREPPFPLAYVAVVTALTVPLTLLLPMLLGMGGVALDAVRKRLVPSSELLLVVASALASMALISHPQVPHFGGVKHWFPSMPFWSLLAGASVWRAVEGVRARFPRMPSALAPALLSSALLFPALLATARVYPYGTSFYGELAGGIPGAASLGMQRQFWSNNVTGVLGWLNAHAPQGARVWLHEVNGFSFRDYQRNGMLRPDLRPAVGPEDAVLAAYQYHQEFREQELLIWQAFKTHQPLVDGLYLDETPQVVLYARPGLTLVP